jgi:hypothetical protein
LQNGAGQRIYDKAHAEHGEEEALHREARRRGSEAGEEMGALVSTPDSESLP